MANKTEKRCRVCGCSEFDPCIDPTYGEPCAWTPDRIPLCSVCGAFAWMMVPAVAERGISIDELMSRIKAEIEARIPAGRITAKARMG